MNKKLFLPIFFSLLLLGLSALIIIPNPTTATPNDNITLLLYDAASGTLPQAPLMNFAVLPVGGTTPVYQDNATMLDTMNNNGIYAGWVSEGTVSPGFPSLDRTPGFQIDFTFKLAEEFHTNANRAGYSIILLSSDVKGIELAFWPHQIWAQNDTATGGLFTHGESVVYTTTTYVDYQVIIVSNTYTLTAETLPILTGPIRDYTDFIGPIDPYETPNFLFVGDDTTSARSRFFLTYLTVTGNGFLTPTPTATPTDTSTPTNTPTSTPTPTDTPTDTPTPTDTATRIITDTPTPSDTPSPTENIPTETVTPTREVTSTNTPSADSTPSPSPSPTQDALTKKIYLPIVKATLIR